MLEIHHTRGTRAFRVIWTCEELALPYRVVPVDFSPEYRSSPAWRRLNPVGKVPAMVDGEFTMFESCAMVQYILDRYGEGRLQPEPGTSAHATYLQWCWFAESTYARPLGEIVNDRRAFPDAEKADVVAEMKDRARTCERALDEALDGREYLLGEHFTAADIVTGYSTMIARHILDEPAPPNLAAWFDRVSARPTYAATRAAERPPARD